jgi:hypothetical protein
MSVSPFHEGESRIQERFGVRDEIEPWARRVVRPYLPDQHRDFYAQLPFLVAAARDRRDRPWVTLLVGDPNFASSPGPETLRIDALPCPGDALAAALTEGADVGFLGIELETRRRNRVNGTIATRDRHGFDVTVGQAFGNCPQHITVRETQRVPRTASPPPARITAALTQEQIGWIERADTFFIATGHRGEGDSATYGMDASHRGGPAGFVRVQGSNRISWDDYPGNNHFNTLGNLELDPGAGLLFVDFESGSLLQLTGEAYLEGTTERQIHFDIHSVVEQAAVLPLRWSLEARRDRVYRVASKQPESTGITSFELVPEDGEAVPGFRAGQHLPVTIGGDSDPEPLNRTYSLSGRPGAGRLRISVKREPHGAASRRLHDQFEVGDRIVASRPAGEFVLPQTPERPIVLVSAGVGVTPMVAMAHALIRQPKVPVWYVHGARDGAHHPFRDEIRQLAALAPHIGVHTRFSRPRDEDPADAYDSRGRVDIELLEKLVPGLGADFYLCGPIAMLDQLTASLESAGVPADRVHFESFGPTGS